MVVSQLCFIINISVSVFLESQMLYGVRFCTVAIVTILIPGMHQKDFFHFPFQKPMQSSKLYREMKTWSDLPLNILSISKTGFKKALKEYLTA